LNYLTKVTALFLATGIVLLITLLAITTLRIRSEVREAKAFCESLVIKIESEKKVAGVYPKNLDAKWWADETIPRLINTNNFYISDGSYFFLWFKVPWAMENVWGIGSRETKWINYDAN
jgi:hypothetical protein